MLKIKKRHLLSPKFGCDWADKMVLNPAMIRDPGSPGTIHMLFRASGPWPRAAQPGRPLPYPIFIGYGVSHDHGDTWSFDFSRPALAPRLDDKRDDFERNSFRGGKMFDYANGCIEDPRLFYFEDKLYLSVACRAFAPGPYWEHDDPVQCMPDWAHDPALGTAVVQNSTVTMLYQVDLAKLAARQYEKAFSAVAPLHQPDVSDDRDVMLFPRRLKIGGEDKIVCLHRPKHPWHYEIGKKLKAPSIFLAAADDLSDFYRGKAESIVLAKPEFAWEANRIGASWAPLEIRPGLWLLPYHGKQDDQIGYTQSFMVLRENGSLRLTVERRRSDRLWYADEPWELAGDFTIPCLFTCSGVLLDDGRLLMGYGAADAQIGLFEVDFMQLLQHFGV